MITGIFAYFLPLTTWALKKIRGSALTTWALKKIRGSANVLKDRTGTVYTFISREVLSCILKFQLLNLLNVYLL
jgi:hypothetical protein